MRLNHLVFECKYLLTEYDSELYVTEHTVEDELRQMASIYYCGKLLTCFLIPNLSEAREMAKQYGWTKIIDDFTFFRCMLDLYLAGMQRKHVAKIASNAWRRASEEARKSFDIS
ncbi:4151_t:CDS:1 [Paraglomus brasilianum]|uniref:4151_t:CDS:1 n=1 Tax=Paraglomus brasilianum TaxID=144538 RepID=A0A9N9C5R2_9GLOM|nr:4151_t:CDS:1 [Paraglomus brasilianum]